MPSKWRVIQAAIVFTFAALLVLGWIAILIIHAFQN